MKYTEEIVKAMSMLADNPKTIFIGQAVEYEGTGLYDSLSHLPKNKRMELPVAEYLQSGLANIVGTGYHTAFDTAMGQFNTEQDREMAARSENNAYGLGAIQKLYNLGAEERKIESEGITADKKQFEEERDFPYKQVQYMQSLLQDLPVSAQEYSYTEPSALNTAAVTSSDWMTWYNSLFGDTT